MQKELSIIYINPKDVVFDQSNARGHSDDDLSETESSISRFGFRDPIEIRPDLSLIAGEGRVLCALKLGLEKIPAIVQTGLDPRETMAYALANNKTAERSFWKIPQLSENLSALVSQDFEISGLGFTDQEIEALLKDDTDVLPKDFPGRVEVKAHDRRPAAPNDDDDLHGVGTSVCQLGDVWKLGPHVLKIHQYGDPYILPLFDAIIKQWQDFTKEIAIDANGKEFGS